MVRKILLLALLSIISIGVHGKTWKPSDLKAPKFTKDKWIINPDGLINKENKDLIEGLRKTCFFGRYVEPVIVSVEDISESGQTFVTKLAAVWDLEAKTNGRFIIQMRVGEFDKFYYHVGSKIKKFYPSSYFRRLNNEYKDDLDWADGGTYDFVFTQKVGDHIFKQISFDTNLDYDNNDKLPFYPDYVAESNGELEIYKYSEQSETNTGSVNSLNDRENLINGNTNEILDDTETTNKTVINTIDYSTIKYESSNSINSISDVPNQRSINDIWVSNPQGVISVSDANEIDRKVKEINANTGYEIAVVVLEGINGQNAFDFGLELFNSWGIGQKETNNGLLIMVLSVERNLTFITGSGTELVLSDATTNNIGNDYMKPHFKEENYAKGILNGLDEIETIFKNGGPLPESTDSDYNIYNSDYSGSSYSFFDRPFVKIYLGIMGVLLLLYIILLIVAMLIKDLHSKYHKLKLFNLLIFPILFPIPFAILYFVNKSLMDKWRNTVRFSEKNGEIMHKMDEDEEDAFLSKGQITEETIKSIDYDVWVTANKDDVLILRYANWITKFNKCPSCKFKTYYKEYDRTVVSPTYSSSGTGEKKFLCKNCGHVNISTYTIPKLTRSSSSSSGGYSSGGGGGSSWGGGLSSGGGSSSGW